MLENPPQPRQLSEISPPRMNLKEVYNHGFLATLADTVAKADQKFDKQKFLKNFPKEIWAKKELKQRMRAISTALEGTKISGLNPNPSLAKNFQ